MAAPFGQSTGAFGAKPFSFGTPGATGGMFGAPSTPAFGAPASTPAFGAASTPGVTFGAVSTPGFGASTPAGTSNPFGASAPAFGSSPFAASAPAFGAPGSAFGAASASAFGAASSPALGFSFAPASPSPAPSPFGAMPSPAAQQGGLFGQATQMAPVAFSSGLAPDTAVKEIQEIRAAYTPNSPAYKFQHLFLNVVENPAQRVKPSNLADEMRWRQVLAQAGGPNNPDKLWPVLALGFKDLLLRSNAQNAAIEENQQRLKALSELSQRLQRQNMAELKRRTGDVQRRHVELSNRLLHVTRLLDGLESRLANSLGYQGDLSESKELELSRQLSSVEAEVSASSMSGLHRRLEAVANAARLRSRCAAAVAAGAGGGGAAAAKLDDKSLQQLFAVLKEHADGVRHLQEVLKRDQMDLQIIRQHTGGRGG